jgi:hypothetical protein
MMQTDDLPIDNLKVGIFSFGQDVTQVYPATGCGAPGSEACQAGDDWGTASNLVGSYPTKANEPEPGIQPIVSYNFGQTDFNTVMTNLANQYLTTPSGSGTQPDSPAKVLFLVTDGMGDVGTGGARAYGPLLTSLCDTFKKSPQNGGLGYTIYVVYTPYYSLMNSFYITNIAQYTEPVDTSPVAANLAACSSDPTNDFVITNPNDPYAITKALQRFLTIALNSAARFTQ